MTDRQGSFEESAQAGRDPHGAAAEAMQREMARLAAQGEKILGPGDMAQGAESGQTGAPSGNGEMDAVERWARRVGRGLGYAFALYLLWHLLSTYLLLP